MRGAFQWLCKMGAANSSCKSPDGGMAGRPAGHPKGRWYTGSSTTPAPGTTWPPPRSHLGPTGTTRPAARPAIPGSQSWASHGGRCHGASLTTTGAPLPRPSASAALCSARAISTTPKELTRARNSPGLTSP